MKGPTMRRLTCGSARRTAKPPRSTLRGTMTRSMASAAAASPGAGSATGEKLIRASRGFPSLHVERLGAGRLAAGIERDPFDPRLGLPQQVLAAALERLTALVDHDRFFERHLALFKPLHDRFELLDRALEGE